MNTWASDMTLIYFIYGAAFLFMGVSILRQPKPADDCRLGRHIWLLAMFGLLHGLNEWLDLLREVRGADALLDAVRSVVLPLSFLPLLEFGRRLMAPWLGRWGGPWLFALPLAVVTLTTLAGSLSISHTLMASRYAMALPGGLLTGFGLLLYSRGAEPWLDSRQVHVMLLAAGGAFLCYALLAGLVVPPLDVPLARTLNSQWFLQQTGLPVQLFRALCAIIAGITMWQLLGAFERERERHLRALATEAREALEQTRRLSREQRLILDAAVEGIVGLDGGGRVTFSNPAASALLGYGATELRGRPLHELVHVLADGTPQPPESCSIQHLLHSEGGSCVSRAEILRRKDSSCFLVELSGATIRDEQGVATGAVVTFRDVTERRAQEAQLRLHDRALEAAREGVLITDASNPGQPIIYANRAFSTITGYSREEVIGRNPAFLQGEDRQQAGIARLRHLVSHGEAGVVMLRNYRKDGTLFWNELNLAPVMDEAGGLSHYVGIMNDISERIAYERELEQQAHHDALTGLANRVLLRATLEQALAQARRHDAQVAVLFLDVDQFKMVNDAFGHSSGDRLLIEVARRLLAVVREADTVARLGGDEFAIILTDPQQGEDAAEIGRRILEGMARPMHIDGHELYVTASIGAALFPRDGDDGEALLRNADAAMYRAKALGRNCFQYWSEAMNARLSERLELLGQLRGAVERGELRLHYQPQVTLPGGHIAGVEALVRWQHPQLGLVPPVQFIPLAEESGLIEPIGEWVLLEACRQAVAWEQAGFAPLRMSVNLSARQFGNTRLEEVVGAALAASGLPAQRLELELTETAVMAEPEQSAVRLAAIRRLGVQLALDDFGTGYSSLGYLKRFAFDRIKIDRSFVTDVIRNPEDAAIVRTVIAMARLLGMATVAEGAELAETVAYLGRNGCDEVQGYFVTRPLPAAELERDFLARDKVQEVAELFTAQRQRTLLVLDDEAYILHTLQRLLRDKGWQVLTTSEPEEAFALLARHEVQVVVSDQRMPAMSGTEFLSRIRELYPETIRIVLSGYADLDSVSAAVNRGWIYKFLTKPWDDAVLVNELEQAFQQYECTAFRNGEE